MYNETNFNEKMKNKLLKWKQMKNSNSGGLKGFFEKNNKKFTSRVCKGPP